MRLQVLIAGIGIALLVSSFIPPPGGMGVQGSIDYGSYMIRMYGLRGDARVDIELYEGLGISFYVLTTEDALLMLEERSIANTTPCFSLENTTEYSGIISIPSIGIYAFVVTTYYNTTSHFYVGINNVYPQMWLLIPGVILVAIGFILFTGTKLWHQLRELKTYSKEI